MSTVVMHGVVATGCCTCATRFAAERLDGMAAPLAGAYQPTAPSMSSRMMSACPLWRAYSSIMWL
jgi:hypothetical protein